MRTIIDVHCHFFNVQYALMEMAAASWKIITGNYPHEKDKKEGPEEKISLASIEGVIDFAAYCAGLIKTAVSSCNEHNATERKEFQGSKLGADASLIVTPLMMDIYFALDDNKDELKTDGLTLFPAPDDEAEEWDEHLGAIKKLVWEELQKLEKESMETIIAEEYFDSIFEEVKQGLITNLAQIKEVTFDGIEMSPGYMKHLQDLETLCHENPGKVIPFLAVDPRRIGIMKLIEMKVGQGVFKGIKLYPPLGYLPSHPNLEQVYQYCHDNDIPITVHCSQGGMKNFRKENYVKSWETALCHIEDFRKVNHNKSKYYADPQQWLPVMVKWPKLRINFAHFGGGDENDAGAINGEWVQALTTLMENYSNVFTDMAYLTNQNRASQIYHWLDSHPVLNKRLMFATDYIMIMMDRELGGLGKYFNNFSKLDDNILSENARRFLKIEI